MSSLQSVEDPELQHVDVSPADHGEPMQEQAPCRNCSPWRGALTGAGFLAVTAVWTTSQVILLFLPQATSFSMSFSPSVLLRMGSEKAAG